VDRKNESVSCVNVENEIGIDEAKVCRHSRRNTSSVSRVAVLRLLSSLIYYAVGFIAGSYKNVECRLV
jgi:hypothetical protein